MVFTARRHRASKPQGSSKQVLPWQVTMDQLTCASLPTPCVLSPLLFNIFFAAVLTVVLQRFSENTAILAELMHVKEPPTSMGPEPAMDYVRRAVWGVLYADDACIVSRSPQGLAKIMEVIVEVYRAFALTVSAKKTKTRCLPPPHTPRTMVRVEAAGQIYKQVQSFTYLGGAVTETPDMSVEIARRTRACLVRIRRYLRPTESRALPQDPNGKGRGNRGPPVGCSTWTLRQEHYAKLRTVHHHRVLLRIITIGAQRKIPDHWVTPYNRALEIIRCESIETTLRTRRLLWAGAFIRMSGGRLPKRIVVFGNLEGAVRRGRGGKEKEWTDCVQSNIRASGITGDWEATALKAEV